MHATIRELYARDNSRRRKTCNFQLLLE